MSIRSILSLVGRCASAFGCKKPDAKTPVTQGETMATSTTALPPSDDPFSTRRPELGKKPTLGPRIVDGKLVVAGKEWAGNDKVWGKSESGELTCEWTFISPLPDDKGTPRAVKVMNPGVSAIVEMQLADFLDLQTEGSRVKKATAAKQATQTDLPKAVPAPVITPAPKQPSPKLHEGLMDQLNSLMNDALAPANNIPTDPEGAKAKKRELQELRRQNAQLLEQNKSLTAELAVAKEGTQKVYDHSVALIGKLRQKIEQLAARIAAHEETEA